MAISETGISTAIELFITTSTDGSVVTDKSVAIKNFADELSTIIADAIKSADVLIPIGGIQPQGTALAQSNTVALPILTPLS